LTTTPALVRAEAVTGAGQVISGGFATGGGGGGVGVGALGVLLHAAPPISASSVRTRMVPPPWFFSVMRYRARNSRECRLRQFIAFPARQTNGECGRTYRIGHSIVTL
jgi:hypothetical protein